MHQKNIKKKSQSGVLPDIEDLKKIYNDSELTPEATIKNFRIVQTELNSLYLSRLYSFESMV